MPTEARRTGGFVAQAIKAGGCALTAAIHGLSHIERQCDFDSCPFEDCEIEIQTEGAPAKPEKGVHFAPQRRNLYTHLKANFL